MFLINTFNFRDGDGEQLKQTGGSLFIQINKLPSGDPILETQTLVLVNLAYGVTVLIISGMIIIGIYKFLSNF